MRTLIFIVVALCASCSNAEKISCDNKLSKQIPVDGILLVQNSTGFKQYLKEKLNEQNYNFLKEVSREFLTKYKFSNNYSQDVLVEHYVSVLEEKLGEYYSSLPSCSNEAFDILTSVKDNVYYPVYRLAFDGYFAHYNIPLRYRAEFEPAILLMTLSGSYREDRKGTCKKYTQISESGSELEFELCN